MSQPAPALTVSVVIPTYNAAPFIGDALDSVTRQTYPAMEVIVCDDGSTDDTVLRASAWESRPGSPRLRLLPGPNDGVSTAGNRGILAATSDLIALLDADDVFCPDHLATLVPAFAQSPERVIAFADAVRHGGGRDGECLLDPIRDRMIAVSRHTGIDGLWSADARLRAIYLRWRRIAPSTWVIRRYAMASIGLFEPTLRYAEDTHFFFAPWPGTMPSGRIV